MGYGETDKEELGLSFCALDGDGEERCRGRVRYLLEMLRY